MELQGSHGRERGPKHVLRLNINTKQEGLRNVLYVPHHRYALASRLQSKRSATALLFSSQYNACLCLYRKAYYGRRHSHNDACCIDVWLETLGQESWSYVLTCGLRSGLVANGRSHVDWGSKVGERYIFQVEQRSCDK